jgi:hypothetical protein
MKTTEQKISEIKMLLKNTPNGVIIDADTILADYIDNSDSHVTGLATEVFEIYLNSNDKESVKRLFYTLTGTEFETYLNEVLEKTTRG